MFRTQPVDKKQVYCKSMLKFMFWLLHLLLVGFYSPAIPSIVFQIIENLKLYVEIIE